MPIRKDRYEQAIQEREAAEREAARYRLWYSVRTLLLCFAWQMVGGALVGYRFTSAMPAPPARTLIDSGGGTLLTILVRQRRMEREGD